MSHVGELISVMTGIIPQRYVFVKSAFRSYFIQNYEKLQICVCNCVCLIYSFNMYYLFFYFKVTTSIYVALIEGLLVLASSGRFYTCF